MSCDCHVGVIGGGVIGIGVVENLAVTGHDVVLLEVCEERLQNAMDRLRTNCRASRLLGDPRYSEGFSTISRRIHQTVSYDPLRDVSYVIENAVERWEVKKGIYEKLDSVCNPECIFAVNTSAIPIAFIAAFTKRSDRVVGVHFMNPVPHKASVEVIRSSSVSVRTMDRIEQLLARMGKRGIVVNDGPGFVSNRILMLTINEAIRTVEQGVAATADVDQIFRECFGHPMGPLETADLIGLDTILDTLQVLLHFTADDKFTPSPRLCRMVEAGQLGRKTGQGFYTYE